MRAALWYTLGRGSFPRRWSVRTPVGPVRVTLYSVDDLVTLVECFGKLDYAVHGDEKVIVDFGSNIGISGLYFLTHAPRSHVHLFEPVPTNVERLRENLRGFEDRVTLSTVAVGTENATAEFTVEPTGRYGGLGVSGSETISVEVLDANDVLSSIAEANGSPIDVVKLDIEGVELAVLQRLSPEVLAVTHVIYAELFDDRIALPGFVQTHQGAVTRYERSGTR